MDGWVMLWNPETKPSSQASRGKVKSRWSSRFAIGGSRSYPSTADSGGLAAATIATVSGS